MTEGSTANFHIELQKAHRTGNLNFTAPLIIEVTPVGTLPAGFTGADYSIALSGSPAGVSIGYDATENGGKGKAEVSVFRTNPSSATSTSLTSIPLVLTLASDSDTETGGTVNFGITGLGYLQCTALNEPDTVEQGCYHVGTVKVGTDRAPFQLAMDLVDETGELQISEVDSGANDNAIEVTEGTDNGFAITFTRIPTNDLASVAASLPVDISRMVSITGAGSASGITADDFVPNLQIDYNGGVDDLATLTPMTNIKGFPGGVSTSTGLVLNFNQGGGAGNADDANTLYFGIKDDDLIEADETFNLVIDPAGTALLATIAGKPFKISTRRVIAVTIKSEDNMTVAARTTTPVQEFGAAPNNQAYQQGELEVNFTGAELATDFTGEITFYDAGGDPISGVALATGVGKSTTGVVYTPATSRTNSTYTLPANTSPIKMVFEIDLPSERTSDGVQTIIYAEMNVPDTWVVTDLAQTGAPTGLSTRRIDVEVIDADINAAKVLFGAATGSWSGGQDVYITADRRTLYQHQTSSNTKQCGVVRLSRNWNQTQPLTVNLAVTGGNLGVVAGSGEPASATSAAVSIANGSREGGFCVKLTTSAGGGTAEGFATSTITATPQLAYTSGGGGNHPSTAISLTPDSARHIRLDDDNNFTIAAPTATVSGISSTNGATKNFNAYQVVEGETLNLTLAGGASVTAPTGENYGVQVGTTFTGETPLPQAIGSGQDYGASLTTTTATTLAPAGTVSVPIDSATGGDNANGDAFINGNRYALLGSLLITPANRGASTTATSATVHAAQTPRIVEIQDDDSANIAPSLTAGYPRSGSGATAAERATQQFNSGAKVAENATATHDFNILLTKAHRAQDVRTTTATGVAPLVIELEPIGTIPAGFSGFDYSVAIGSATAGVSVAYSPAGNGVTTISVKRQNTNEDSVSVTSIPLKLTLKPDDDVEGGGVVNFGITGLGHLQCSTLVEPATVQEGCYHAGAVAHTDGRARFQLSMDLADEGGALTISETDGNTDGLIEITENASANNGFGLVFSRLPEGGLADRTGGYTANINSYVSVEDVHSDLNANDFKPPLQIDYDGGVDELVDLTGINISNIKGFGGASSTTGLSLKFAETGGASAGASVNTLFFAVENDDIVEEDETFTLVIDPGPTGVATIPLGVADVNAKITGKTSIAVTIKSEDAITVSGDTTTAIREGGNGRTLAKGQYKLDFTGAEYPRAQRLNVVFTQTTDGGSPTQLTTGSSGQVSLAAATTSGVTLNSSGVLALPANVDDIDVVFDVGLKTSASASDSGVTAVQMVLDAPTLGTTADSSLDASSQAGKYVADIGVVDSDQQTYEVKFEVNDANVATVQENGNTDIPVKIHLVPMGSASGFPAGTADLNDVTSGVQGLVFELTLTKDGTALTDQGFTAGKKDSTWNATKGRYEWDLTIAGNNTAEANRLFAASVQTKTDWSSADFSHLTDGSYRPISNDAEEAEFTVYDDDNTVSFNSATPASVDAGTEEGTDDALVKVNSEFVARQEAVVLGADVGSDAPEYLISFAVSSPDGADPLEYGGTKDYTITAVDSSKVADATRQGNFKLASDGTIGDAVLLATGAGQDEIIEDTEGVKITLTGVEPANRGLKLSDDADDNSRIFLFADATADGVSILSLSATAPEANHFTNTGDQRVAAEKVITGVVEGVDIPVYIHLSKPTEKEQSFVLKHCCGQKEEYDFGGVETNSGRTIFSIPASVAGTKVGSTLITMTVDDEAESSQTHDFEISKLGDNAEGVTTPASDFPIQDSEKSIKIVTADEAGELIITNKDVRIAEGIDTLTLTIRRQGALNAAGDAIGARLTFAYGTVEGQPAATQGTGATRDYTEDTKNKDVVFTQVGSNEYQEVTVDLDLRVFNGADDTGDGVEGPEFFTVKIATASRRGSTSTVPGAVTIANTNTVPVQIVDSETAIVSFAEETVTFKEGQENAIVKVNVSPTRRLNRVSLDPDGRRSHGQSRRVASHRGR